MGGYVMKSKIIILFAFALIISACGTSSYVASSWVDDIYFTPGDVPPPMVINQKNEQKDELKRKSADRVIVSEIRDNSEGSKTMNNYIFDGQDAGTYSDAQLYNLDQMALTGSDTTVFYDDNEIKYVINNYFESDNLDFGYRIRRFHRPFFYDPYYYDYYGWDSWYYPTYGPGWSFGWGWNSWAWGSSWGWPYYGWGSPFSSWYSPYYSWYSPYYTWYSPYSYWGWGGHPYYGGYWDNIRYANREDYTYGPRRDFNTSAVYGDTGSRRSGVSATSNNDSPLKSARPGAFDNDSEGRRGTSVSGVSGGGRPSREVSVSASEQGARTHTELRRDISENTTTRSRYTSSSADRGNSDQGTSLRPTQDVNSTNRQATQGTYTRPANTNNSAVRQGSEYTPSYNQQRTINRSTYNIQGTTRPTTGNQESVTKSATTPSSTYTRPSSATTNTTRTYRSTTTYNRSSSSGTSTGNVRSTAPSGNSYRAPARSIEPSSSGSSYSAPARSSSPSSSGSFSSGGSSSSGSSGGSHSSGGGTNSSSGRR